MSREHNELKAGVFIVITFVMAVIVVVWINGAGMGPAQVCTVSFKLSDDIGGLRVGDDVRLGGLKVGIVRDIHPQGLGGPDPRILVTMSLPASYPLHRDAAIGVQTGLTGSTNVNIESVGSGRPLPPGTVLIGRPDAKTAWLASISRIGPRLESAISQIDQQTIPKVTQTADAAKTLITHANEKIEPIVEHYNKVTERATVAIGQVNDLVGDTKPDIRGTLKNLNAASGTIKDRLPGLADQVSQVVAKVDKSLTTAQAALVDVQKTAANAKELTSSLRSVIVDNRSKLDSIVASIKTSSDNIKVASVEIRHSPWRLLYKPSPGEAANLNLYDSAREFADGAGSLSDAASALKDALHDPQADRAQIQRLVGELDLSFNRFQQVENKLWTTARQ